MKRILVLWSFFSFTACYVFAQDNGAGDVPVAVPVSHGVWVYLGKTVPKNMQYKVERSKGDSKRFEKLSDVTAPASESEMKDRQMAFGKYFEKLDPVNDKTINRLWQSIQKYESTDSLFSDNLPVMHLLAGTAYFDASAAKGEDYVYRVSLISRDGKNVSTKESNASGKFRKGELPSIKFVNSKYASGKLELNWSVKDPLKMSHFNVYRSVFGKDEYQKIQIEKGLYNQKDNLILLAIDTIGTHPAWYEYEIAAVDAYGNEGERQGHASGSNVQDYYAPPVSNFKAVNTGSNHEVKLSWRFDNKRYLNGISVMRSTIYDSGYRRIATVPVTDTAYTDILPVSGENYYYYLLLLSADNDPIPTAKIFVTYTNDKAKPVAPNEIDASTITNGIKVYWKCEEPYAKGFYVYRKADNDATFTMVSPLIASGAEVYSFTDTSRQLVAGGVYEYFVRTINDNNQMSNPSDTVSANPGIKKSIAAPMNLRYRSSDGQISILWDDMRKWEPDLLGYKIFRKTGNGGFVIMANDSLQPGRNFYTDSTINAGIEYEYAVSAFDISGNKSERSMIKIPAVAVELPGPPPGITVSQAGNDVYITWGQISGDINAIKIYRSEPGVQPALIATITEADFFNNKNVKKGKLYFYQLATVSLANQEGVKSEKLSLRVK